MIVVDSHQHFWSPAELELPPFPPDLAVLDRAFLPDDLEPELRRAGVHYTVLVQGFPQTKACNCWLFRQANKTSFVAGVVAWADLLAPNTLDGDLDELEAEPKFVGIRHIVEQEVDLDWILQDTVLASLQKLADRNIPYDMVARPQHLSKAIKVLDKVPGLRMVIDHIAKPDVAHGGSPHWADDLAEVARRPQVCCKLSGMVTEADWKCWQPSDIKPYVEHVVECFGYDRLMYGSDWPVCLLAADYLGVWNMTNELISDIGQDDCAKIFGANAIRFYGLTPERMKAS